MGFKENMKEAFGAARIGRLNNLQAYLKGPEQHRKEFEAIGGQRLCVLVGMANYGNIGDLAISEAQLQFMRRNFEGSILEIPTMHFWEYEKLLKEHLKPQDVLCLQGGGNMSDLYYWFEYERCSVMEVFPKVRTLVLPQTLAYAAQDSSLLRYSQRAYARCSDLRLFARERVSEELMKKTYPHTDVRLVPDIVLSLDAADYADFNLPRRTLTTMLRKDEERKLTDADWSIIHEAARAMSLPLKETDTIIETMDITPQQRKVILRNMLNIFASSRVVITDRLHGMIFAAITGTPCVVLSNSNHKIQGVYEWIKDLPYIEFISDVHETQGALNRVIAADTTYPLERIRKEFAPLKDCLR